MGTITIQSSGTFIGPNENNLFRIRGGTSLEIVGGNKIDTIDVSVANSLGEIIDLSGSSTSPRRILTISGVKMSQGLLVQMKLEEIWALINCVDWAEMTQCMAMLVMITLRVDRD